MAVQLQGTIQSYLALSTDFNSFPVTGVNAGAQLYCTDSGDQYVFNGKAWQTINKPTVIDDNEYMRKMLSYQRYTIMLLRELVDKNNGDLPKFEDAVDDSQFSG